MHFIFESKILGYRNGYIQAKLQNLHDWNSVAVKWDVANPLEPLAGTLGPFRFEVRQNVSHPDNYWTGANLDLYSERLLALFRELEGMRYETYEAIIQERKTSRQVLENYRVFRLMETFPFIDPQRSTLGNNGTRIERAVLFEQADDKAPLLFRDDNFRHLVFMHSELKNRIEQSGITGCQFQTLEQYLEMMKSGLSFYNK